MQFDISQFFHSTRDIGVLVETMDYPFLLNYAFDFRPPHHFKPEALSVFLMSYCRQITREHKPDQALARIQTAMDHFPSEDKTPHGFFGLDNLPVQTLNDRQEARIVVGMTGACFSIRRFGQACLGIRPTDRRGESHEESTKVLNELMRSSVPRYFGHFIHRYGFSITPTMEVSENSWVLDLQQELEIMARYLPNIRWNESKPLTMALADDFTELGAGVVVGNYGDAEVWAHLTSEQTDGNWRQGYLRRVRDSRMYFSNRASTRPPIEYFVRTICDNNYFRAAPVEIDYSREQDVLGGLARMLYVGLYERMHQRMLENNSHCLRFRLQAAPAVATA